MTQAALFVQRQRNELESVIGKVGNIDQPNQKTEYKTEGEERGNIRLCEQRGSEVASNTLCTECNDGKSGKGEGKRINICAEYAKRFAENCGVTILDDTVRVKAHVCTVC